MTMTPEEWKQCYAKVTDEMLAYTKPFATPLSSEPSDDVKLVGSGSYISSDEQRFLLTCEHVARINPIHYRFSGCDNVFACRSWNMEKHPVDAAITNCVRNATTHNAVAVPYKKLSSKHQLHQPEELLFFRGYSGENAHYGFGIHQANGSGYCSQEMANSGDDLIFEMFWEHDLSSTQ